MKQYTENGIRILEPENGLWLTDGETYSQKVYLGRNADASAWRDATATEKAEWEAMQNEPRDEQAESEALTRYANELTGASDPDLISAAETLIEQRIKEES